MYKEKKDYLHIWGKITCIKAFGNIALHFHHTPSIFNGAWHIMKAQENF